MIDTTTQQSNTSWYFGCSFVAGYGVDYSWVPEGHDPFTPANDLYKCRQWGYSYNDASFSKLLSKYYSTNHRNYALPGQGYELTLYRLWQCMPSMKTGDYVILGHTDPYRILMFDSAGCPDTATLYYKHEKKMWDMDGEVGVKFVDDKQKQTLIDYGENVIIKSYMSYEKYYIQLFNNIANYFESIGITCNIIHQSVWKREVAEDIHSWTLNDDTLDEVVDSHWSPNGHRTIYNLIVKARKLGIRDITKQLVDI